MLITKPNGCLGRVRRRRKVNPISGPFVPKGHVGDMAIVTVQRKEAKCVVS